MSQRLLELAAEQTRLREAVKQGRAFVVSYRPDAGVPAGETINLRVANPADSGVTLDVVWLRVATQFRAEWTVYDQLGDSVSGGTAVTPDGLRLNSASEAPADTVATLTSDVTFTDQGTPHWEGVIPSGGAGGQTSGGVGAGTEPDIEPGREIVIELLNSSDTGRPGMVGCVFLETASVRSEE